MIGQLNAAGLDFFQEFRTNTRGFKFPMDISICIGRYASKDENILHGYDIAFHADNFA